MRTAARWQHIVSSPFVLCVPHELVLKLTSRHRKHLNLEPQVDPGDAACFAVVGQWLLVTGFMFCLVLSDVTCKTPSGNGIMIYTINSLITNGRHHGTN